MRIAGIIPARYESSRFPGKLLALLGGIPLIMRVYRKAQSFKKWSDLLVATDDERIYSYCNNNGVSVVMTSPDHSDCLDRAAEVANSVEADRYVVIQGDEPFFDVSILDADFSPSVVNFYTKITNEAEITDSNVVKVVVSRNLKAIYFSRFGIPFGESKTRKSNDDLNIDKQIGVYVFSREALRQFGVLGMSYLEGIEGIGLLRFLENDIDVHMRYAQSDSLSIDTPEDLAHAERLISSSCG